MKKIHLFLILCIAFEAIAVESLSTAVCRDLVEHLADKKVLKSRAREQLRSEMRAQTSLFLQQCYDQSLEMYLDGQDLLRVISVNQHFYTEYAEQALLIQREEGQKEGDDCYNSIIIVLPKDFKDSIRFSSVKSLFEDFYHDDSDFRGALMICLFSHQASCVRKAPKYGHELWRRPARYLYQITGSIEKEGYPKPKKSSWTTRIYNLSLY